VAIVGCGPAGLTLAAQLALIPGISTRIFEQKSGPLALGQADGIACRSMEMFRAFGFHDRVLREGYQVNETVFWRPGPDGSGLARADRIQDVEDDLSEMPHMILNQARVHRFFLDVMERAPARLTPDYNRALTKIEDRGHDGADTDYPIRATFDCLDRPGQTETLRARYLVGADGARSTVRRHLGHRLEGAAARQLWGVMDVLAVTDFPDARLKCAVQSADRGSLLIIPREGGYLMRLYIELDALHGEERATDRGVTPEMLEARARAILAPYSFAVKEVGWCSAYEIGQRLCDAFDDVPADQRAHRAPRIFIAGEACHTHSPKAGQGMNVSMADTFNLGWKLAAVIRGEAPPDLLHSYSAERQAKAQELIDFDRDMARLFSEKPKTPEEAAQFQAYFQTHGRYTAGVETTYEASAIIGGRVHQALAAGQVVGKRFHSAPVIRLADAKPMQLGEVLLADGRWRLIAFAGAGDTGAAGGMVALLCDFLTGAPTSPLRRHGLLGADVDALFDLRAVFQHPDHALRFEAMPDLLRPRKGRHGLIDYEKIFCPDLKRGPDLLRGADIFAQRGIDRARGALIVVRPDHFVAQVLPLDAHAELAAFFARILVDRSGAAR
jgi:phenol 2-monooxygenase